MKKSLNFVLILLVLVIFSGCWKTVKTVTKQRVESEFPAEEVDTFTVWKESFFPRYKIKVGDPIALLNGAEVLVSGEINHQEVSLVDGKVVLGGTKRPININIPKGKAGKIVQIRNIGGKNLEYDMKFDEAEFEGITLNFQAKPDGSFALNGIATILDDGKLFELKAVSIKKACLLVFNPEDNATIDYLEGEAAGVIVSGTKKIE